MIAFTRETLFDVIEDIEPLLRQHYDELTLNKDRVKLNPMWGEYKMLEDIGRLAIFTARENGALVGYAAFFLVRHLHYADLRMAINDVLFLRADQRKGTAGLRLIRHCETALRGLGVDKVTMHAKHDTNLGPLLEKTGWRNEEMILAKML